MCVYVYVAMWLLCTSGDDGGIGIEIIAGAAAAGGIALLLLIIIVICCGIYIKKKGL